MKILKRIFIILTTLIIAFLALGYFILTNANIQKKFVNEILDDINGINKGKIEIVNIGFSRIILREIYLNLDSGDELSIEEVSAYYDLSALFSNTLNISSLDIQKMEFVQSSKKQVKTAIDLKDIKNINHLETKLESNFIDLQKTLEKQNTIEDDTLDFTLNIKELSAEIKLTASDKSQISFDIDASNLKTNNKLVPISAWIDAKIEFTITDLDTQKLKLSSSFNDHENDKNYTKAQILINHEDKDLLKVKSKYTKDLKDIDLQANIDITKEQSRVILDSILSDMTFPHISSKIYIEASSKDFGKNANLLINSDNDIFNLKSLNSPYIKFDECRLVLQTNITKEGDNFDVDELLVNLYKDSYILASLKTTKEFTIDIQNLNKIPESELLQLDVFNLNTDIINPFLGEFDIYFSNLNVSLIAGKGEGDWIDVSTKNDIVFKGLSIEDNSEKVIENLTLKINAISKIYFDKDVELLLTSKIGSENDNITTKADIKYDNDILDIKLNSEGSLNSLTKGINSISSYLNSELKLKLNAEASLESFNNLNLKLFDVNILDNKNANILNASTLSPIEIDIQTHNVNVVDTKFFKLESKNLPFAIIKPFLNGLDANDVSFIIELSSQEKDVIEIDSYAGINSLYYKINNKPALADLDVNLKLNAQYQSKKDELKLNIPEIHIQENSASLLFGNLNALLKFSDIENSQINSDLKIGLAQLLKQPILEPYANLSKAYAQVNTNLQDKIITSNITLRNMVCPTQIHILDKVEFNAKADVFSDIKTAELDMVADSTKGQTQAKLNLKLSEEIFVDVNSKSLVIEDMLVLANAFKNPTYQESSAENKTTSTKKAKYKKPELPSNKASKKVISQAINQTKDSKAFWDIDKKLTAKLSIDKVIQSSQDVVENFKSTLSANDKILHLNEFEADVYKADISGELEIDFNKENEFAYQIKPSWLNVESLDTREIFVGDNTPIIEGIFDGKLKLNSQGNNLEQLIKNIYGEIQIDSDGGIIRPLDNNEFADAGANLAILGLKIANSFLGSKVKELAGGSELISTLSQMNYNSAVFSAKRNKDTLDIDITSGNILSDSMILCIKNSRVDYNKDISLLEQNLDIKVKTYIKNQDMLDLFRSIDFANENSIEHQGYYVGPEFLVSGTISAPKTNLLSVISEAISKTSTKKVQETTTQESDEEANPILDLLNQITK